MTVLSSCGQSENKQVSKTDAQKKAGSTTTTKPILVDYKSDTYKISLGERYQISDKVVDWGWAALADNDDKIDSTGNDAFIYLGEPLIKYNNGEWLPSLHIETDRNLITSFTCSILFSLEDSTTAIDNFLKQLSKDIKQLKNDQIVKSLKLNGHYETNKTDCIEIFKLTKAKELENDKFEYTIRLDKKNGR